MTCDTTIDALLDRLTELAGQTRRSFVALAGAPGAGKSHVAEQLAAGLASRAPGQAAILPMDGYHLDDGLLEQRGDRLRKGAPHTFDLDGFAAMLERLAADDGRPVLVPVFDRSIEIARAAAREIPASARLIIAEGNYLLLDRPGWSELARRFDLTVFIDVPEEILRKRLAARWAGTEATEAMQKLEGNDLPNMRLVARHSRPADLRLPNG
ncbi:nucleoside/nucleotide kinase family protein [Paracoccus onubensis]|uniref:Nucleoside/nucleotide kinase family protein n=1 Tax=Paracoccus onubensis TaxID=1675788 RepID=A0A418SMG6_9RHOB|nr:nucleoside/nucleotide kinase family protein [Paracoccus onubensis]RJE82131.1 nucleoside/nucleotide kinase family protein [Paracoccus onubensis]